MVTAQVSHVQRRFSNLEKNLPERRYLPELHGVRGLALLGVVLFHLFGAGRVSGGIDVFLTISGFLFTGMLLRESASRGGRIDPLKYYGRLVRRILVPAATVIAAIVAVGLVVYPVTRHRQLWAEARASLLYFENIELINSQLAYGAAGPETSPFQHFWSLSVQGQFYVVWPAVAIVAVLIAKRLNTSAARVMGVLVGVIFVVSLLYATYVSSHSQAEAYLMSTTRAWQLAFGGLLALASGTRRLPRPLRAPAGWVGLLLIVSSGFVVDGAQLFPGPWALWPLVGLALILMAASSETGEARPKGTVTPFLSNRVFGWIGDHAYGLYLWHWPLLIFYMEIRGRDAIGIRGALVVLTATVLLSIAMYRWVERPLQQSPSGPSNSASLRTSKPTAVVMGASLLVSGGLATVVLSPSLGELDASHEGLDPEIYPGAAWYFADEPTPTAAVFPTVEQAGLYNPEYIHRNCQQKGGQAPGRGEVTVCEDENKPEAPTATVVLAGGSHAGHLEATFQALGEKYHWEVLVVTKSSCVFGWEERRDQERCGEWNHNFVQWLEDNPVDLVVTPASRLPNSGGEEYILDLAPQWWQKISDTGAGLLLVRGMPRQSDRAPDCLAAGGTPQECGPSKEGYAPTYPLLDMDLPDSAVPLDVMKYMCPGFDDPLVKNCDVVVGNVLVTYDNHHLTTPFARSLAPAFEAEMKEALPHLFR